MYTCQRKHFGLEERGHTASPSEAEGPEQEEAVGDSTRLGGEPAGAAGFLIGKSRTIVICESCLEARSNDSHGLAGLPQ
jgi:hypothetical protein